jgi:hypothetical protein
MSDPDAPHGSSAFPGGTPGGQPLSEQPTELVQPVPRDARYDTVVGPAPGQQLTGPAPVTQETEPDLVPWDDRTETRPDYRDAPVVVRRADPLAGLLLLLAGIATGVSLLVVWVHGGDTGLAVVSDVVDDFGDPTFLAQDGSWEPLVVVFGGAALFLLGLLMYVPAKTHRLLGALAVLVSLVVAAGVLEPLAYAEWDTTRWAVGGWCTVAIGVLGFLGGLKALSTGPRSRRRP